MTRYKIECIVSTVYLETFTQYIKESNLSGYSVLRIQEGFGKIEGKIMDDEIISISNKSLVIILASKAEKENFMTNVIPFLNQINGLMYWSEVEFNLQM